MTERCTATAEISGALLVCDQPSPHPGLHHYDASEELWWWWSSDQPELYQDPDVCIDGPPVP